MDKLISMVAFVLKQEQQLKRCIDEGMTFTDLQVLKQQIQTKTFLFANFLSQKLELWMFVPCKLVDGVWVVLEEPKKRILSYHDGVSEDFHPIDIEEYKEAKERVLFEVESYTKSIIKSTSWYEYRFTFTNGKYFDFEDDTIYIVEILCEFEPKLTPTAQKQIGL